MAWTAEQQAEAIAILTEIATRDPLYERSDGSHHCSYCEGRYWGNDVTMHEDDCLYVRAQALVAGGTARRG